MVKLTPQDTRTFFTFLLLFLAIGGLVYGAVNPDTLETLPDGVTTVHVVDYLNATYIDLGGVIRSTWPAAGTGGGGLVAPTFIIFVNSTGCYSVNGTDGSVFAAGPIWDLVFNTTSIVCGVTGGKIVLKEGNHSVVMNNPKVLLSNTEVEIQDGATVWLHGNKADGAVLFRATNAENVVIHGNGVIDGNKDNQALGYQTAVELNGCSNCRVDTYIQHMHGWNVVDDMGTNDANNLYINRFYPDAGVKITPAKNLMNSRALSTQICNFSSTFSAAAVNEIYGDTTYITNNVVNGPEALYCVPNLAESATEPVRVQILYAAGQTWNDSNIGIWMYFEGVLPATFDMILEIWDKVGSQALQCTLADVGGEINDEGINRWRQYIFMPSCNTTDTPPRIKMDDIDDIRLRFMSGVDTWNVTIDDMRLYPNYDFTAPKLLFCTDGPYTHQFEWLVPIADQYGYKICFATSYDIPGEDPGNADIFLSNLTMAYKAGHLIGVYVRAYDEEATPAPLSDAEILDFALMQKQYLIDHGLATDFFFAQMNRHLLDTHTEDLLDDYFHIVKGSHPDGMNIWRYPFLSPNIVTTTAATVLTRAQRAYWSELTCGVFNHYNAEPDTINDIKTLFAYCASHNFESVTWQDIYYNQCVVGSR